MSVPNQRIIYIQRTSNDVKSNYLKVSNESMAKATKDIHKIGTYKLWLYLCSNRNGYKKELSSAHFINWSNTSQSTYDRAWKELIELGYIKQSDKNKNVFYFFEESETYNERISYNMIIEPMDDNEFNKIYKENVNS